MEGVGSDAQRRTLISGWPVLRRMAGPPGKALATAMPVLLFAVIYTVVNIFILAAPMAHRH